MVAHANHVPVYAVVPTSTIDLTLASGGQIPIEFRGKEEVISIEGNLIAPADSEVYNPAFDITPHEFITAIITEKGICYPPFSESLRNILSHYSYCSTNTFQYLDSELWMLAMNEKVTRCHFDQHQKQISMLVWKAE